MQIVDYLEFWIFFYYYKDSWRGGLRAEDCEESYPGLLPLYLEQPILSELHSSKKD